MDTRAATWSPPSTSSAAEPPRSRPHPREKNAPMKKMYAALLLLASVSAPAMLAGCGGGKKASTAPAQASPEGVGSTGGAAYGGHDPNAAPKPPKADPGAAK